MSEEDRRNQVGSGQFDSVAQAIAHQHANGQQAATGRDPGGVAGHGQEAVAGEAAAGQGYDEHAWQDYLARSGTQWDGSQQSWEPFTQWFLYYAGESGVRAPAAALIDYLSPLPATERITELGRYGVTITPAQSPAAQSPAAQEEQQETGVVTDEHVATIMDDLLAANPAFAGIPEERRMEIMNEALSELRGRAD